MKTFKMAKPTKWGNAIYLPVRSDGKIALLLMNSERTMAGNPETVHATHNSMKEIREHFSGIRLDKVDELSLPLRSFHVFKSGFLYYNVNTKQFFVVRKFRGCKYILLTDWLKKYDYDDPRIYNYPVSVANKSIFRLVLF